MQIRRVQFQVHGMPPSHGFAEVVNSLWRSTQEHHQRIAPLIASLQVTSAEVLKSTSTPTCAS
eukprot:m.69537 g.69537  ORF g.69537 m.69537 type:complete len:63 (-) comp16027_c0_seq3:325-513(-)